MERPPPRALSPFHVRPAILTPSSRIVSTTSIDPSSAEHDSTVSTAATLPALSTSGILRASVTCSTRSACCRICCLKYATAAV